MQRFTGHYVAGASGGCYGLWRCELKIHDYRPFFCGAMRGIAKDFHVH
jgi:hypothetical protein